MLATTYPTTEPATKPVRILYAEDTEELREVVRLTLVHEGYAVECADNGLTALQKIEECPKAFDVVITDYQMPEMSGLELVTRLRALPFLGKILILTSGVSNEVDEAFQKLKVDNVLNKPIFPHQLRQALDAL
jgi:two-component system chemotaxis response regulator CheY